MANPDIRHYDESYIAFCARRTQQNKLLRVLARGRLHTPMEPSKRRERAEWLQKIKLFKRGTYMPDYGSIEHLVLCQITGRKPPVMEDVVATGFGLVAGAGYE